MSNVITRLAVDEATTEVKPVFSSPTSIPLREQVKEFVRQDLVQRNNHRPTDLYAQVLAEVEKPLLESMLQHTRQNQSTAARLLNISRGTLRKKMSFYGLLHQGRKF